MKLSFSTNAFVRHSLKDAIEHIARIGYEAVEILADVPHLYADHFSPDDLRRLKDVLRSSRIAVANINANTAMGFYGRQFWEPLFEPSLAHPQEDLRKWRVAYTRKCLEIASALEAPSVSITSGRMISGVEPEESLIFLRDSIEQLLGDARKYGVLLGMEYEPGLLIERYEELVAFIDQVASPYLGANLDLGHSHVLGEDPWTVVPGLGPRIFHVHLEDIKSRKHHHLIPGQGDMDFTALRRCLESIEYEGFVTVELYTCSHHPVEAARRSLTHLQRVFAVSS